MKPGKVRPIAICVFRDRDRILVSEGYDIIKQQAFFRPLGGKIEFGEHGAETVRRELLEELHLEVTGVRYLGTLENIFTYNGELGHEIVLVYDGKFIDPSPYQSERITAVEDNGVPFSAIWVSLADYDLAATPAAKPQPPLYPTGLFELLRGLP